MLGASRLGRLPPCPLLRSTPASSFSTVFRRTARLCSMAQAARSERRDKTEEGGDTMSHSFGEGYATRSDEEGFGGIHGGNQSLTADEDEALDRNHPSHPDYDKDQGSEVKQKEKARNQPEKIN